MFWTLTVLIHWLGRFWKTPYDEHYQLRPAWICRALRESGWKPEFKAHQVAR